MNKCVSWLRRRLGRRKPASANSHCTQGNEEGSRETEEGTHSGGSQLVFLRDFFFRDSHAWGLLYLQFLQQSGHCIPGGHVSLSLPSLFPAIPEWLPFLIQKTHWHPVPNRSDQGRWTRAARAAVAASPSRAPGSAGPDGVFPSPRLPERSLRPLSSSVAESGELQTPPGAW